MRGKQVFDSTKNGYHGEMFDEGGRYQIALLSFDEKYDLYATSENLGDLMDHLQFS